jgi:electron transfer DM13
MRALLRKPLTWVVLSLGLVAAVIALVLFEPWRLVTRSEVNDPDPIAVVQTQTSAPAPTSTTSPSSVAPAPPPPPKQPRVLAEGAFVSGEHPTSGAARVIQLPDGSRVLRLENFSTSDGPDVHIWLTDRPAGGPHNSFDDGRYLPLGEMKATDGNQNYAIPANADLGGLVSVVIWCDRFNVAFGSAPVQL